MLKTKVNQTLAAALVGIFGAMVPAAVHAENFTALQYIALQEACTEGGGRFESSWVYNDRGVRWGRVLSCSTSAGYSTCQDGICRGDRWNGAVMVQDRRHGNGGAMEFLAEPVAFAAALSVLAGE